MCVTCGVYCVCTDVGCAVGVFVCGTCVCVGCLYAVRSARVCRVYAHGHMHRREEEAVTLLAEGRVSR